MLLDHFTDKETEEAQKDEVTWPGPHSSCEGRLLCKPTQSDSRVHALGHGSLRMQAMIQIKCAVTHCDKCYGGKARGAGEQRERLSPVRGAGKGIFEDVLFQWRLRE